MPGEGEGLGVVDEGGVGSIPCESGGMGMKVLGSGCVVVVDSMVIRGRAQRVRLP